MENPFDSLNKSIHEKSQQMTKKEYLTAMCFQGLCDEGALLQADDIKTLTAKALFAAKEIIKQCAAD